MPPALRRDPFGIVGSINYVDGPWVLGAYYQYATAPSTTVTPARDQIQIVEVGLSYLLDQNHDLLGEGFYTDLKAYASAYHYDFDGLDRIGQQVPQRCSAPRRPSILVFLMT
jgi:hypothetical protein